MSTASNQTSHRGAANRGTVAVVGLGKIGLPLAIQYARHSYRVIGCDENPQVVAEINAGRSHVDEEPGLGDAVAQAVTQELLRATTNTTAAVGDADVVVLIVPVVVRGSGDKDKDKDKDKGEVAFEAIDAATAAVAAGLRPGTLVIYETTLPVGTTAGRFRAALERGSGLSAERDFFLAYSPERVSSGHIFRDLATYPKVIGGVTPESAEAAAAFYRSVLEAEILLMATAEDAEFVKLIETTYRDVNIALANEFARFADAHGLDLAAATATANTQPYSHIHDAGLGVGGHCIPVYPYFLLQGAPDNGLALVREARRINDAMAEYAAERLDSELGGLAGQSVLLLGVSYRGDVREVAFSSARLVQAALRAHGATVYADDPLYSPTELEALGYTPLPREREGEITTLVVQAAHRVYRSLDLTRFPACRVVLDGRRAVARESAVESIEARGIRYLCIGDGQPGRQPARANTMARDEATRGAP